MVIKVGFGVCDDWSKLVVGSFVVFGNFDLVSVLEGVIDFFGEFWSGVCGVE